MKIGFMPKTKLGKWSVGLNTFFLVAVATSCVLVLVLKILSFDDHWWDMTVAVAFPASIIALVTGLLAIKKYEERSILVNLSILVGLCTILFIPLHSLFISD
jgi:energy-converting hydrogenase Eha subunit A